MTTREEALAFGLSYPDTCQDAPFHDPNWQLVRIKSSKKVFLWTYEKDGYINLNVKADPEWRDYSVGRIKDIIGQLCGRGYLATSQGQYPVVGLGPRAVEVEDEAFAFTVKRRASKRKASARARRAVDLLREEAELDQRPRVGDDAELFERLRALRKEISTELEMAPYMVFSDKALRGLCRLRPQTRDELIQVNGIGEKKADAFGEQFMAAIEEFESEHARDGV